MDTLQRRYQPVGETFPGILHRRPERRDPGHELNSPSQQSQQPQGYEPYNRLLGYPRQVFRLD